MPQILHAKQAAMHKWVSSMQAIMVATAPLRRAGALIGGTDLPLQDELLASYELQLKSVSLSIGIGAGAAAGRSTERAAAAGMSDACRRMSCNRCAATSKEGACACACVHDCNGQGSTEAAGRQPQGAAGPLPGWAALLPGEEDAQAVAMELMRAPPEAFAVCMRDYVLGVAVHLAQ